MATKYNFTISGNSLLMQRTPISEDTQYKAISFKSPSLVQDNNKIKLLESGEFYTSLRFVDFGLIDGVAPTDLQDAKDKLLALIGNINEGGGGNFVPLPGTEDGFPITGDLEVGVDVWRLFFDDGNTKITIYIDGASTGYEILDFVTGYKSGFSFNPNDGVNIISTNPSSRGITSSFNFSANITNFDYPQKIYVDERGSILNTTTAVLSASDLNTLYPNAKDGFSVICPNVIGGGKYYIKAGAGWVYQQILTVV